MEWEGIGLLKIRYEKGIGLPMLLKNRVGRVFRKAKTKEWRVNGLGRLKMKHEKGVRYFMVSKTKMEKGVGYFVVPKSGMGRVWEGST